MAKINNLFGGASSAEMQAAMRELGAYYGVKDKNSFVQVLLKRSVNETKENSFPKNPQASELNSQASDHNIHLQSLADAIISLQGDGEFANQLKKKIDAYIMADPSDPIAKVLDALGNSSTEEACPFSLTLPSNPTEEHKGYLRAAGVDDLFNDGVVGRRGESISVNFTTTEDDTRKAISIIEFHNPNLNFANRDSAAASVFLMSLPSIEISKAVPYFDIKTITKGEPIQKLQETRAGETEGSTVFGGGISIYKFLHGERIEAADQVIHQLARIVPKEFSEPPKTLSGGTKHPADATENEKQSIGVAGMEIFTSPQTMVDGTLIHEDLDSTSLNYGSEAGPKDIPIGSKVLDKFRPLMTVKSFNVQVTPATGMLATKAADVALTLHDKTRMNQIMPFIVPGQLGDVEFLIEWGWSHPQPNPNENPYGALINSMRCKEKYGIMNSSYSFTPEGQVEIKLKLYTKGASNLTFELVSTTEEGKNPADVLKDLVHAIRGSMRSLKKEGYTLNAAMGAPDVLGKASSVGGLLSLSKKDKAKISNFLKKMKRSSAKSSQGTWQEMSEKFDQAEEGAENYQKVIQKQWESMINNTCQHTKSQTDPYLPGGLKSDKIPGVGTVVNIDRRKYVSLAKVIATFVARPIYETGKFEEIQLLFYPMNEYAMWARTLNTGQYPINKEELKKYLEAQLNVNPSISIQRFLNLIKKHFVNFVGDDIYGLSSYYTETEDGKREIKKQYTKDEKAKQKFTNAKVKILEACYGGASAEKRFKKPNIQMWVECVAHKEKPDCSILRLHFFDRACTSYGSYAAMWGATSASNLGVIGKSNSAKKSLTQAKKHPPKKKDAKWDEKVEAREKRETKYDKEADAQRQKFIDSGLLEPMNYTDKDGNPRTKYRIRGGPDQLRGILATNMPTLKYGTEFSGILTANLATNSNPQLETIHMQRQGAKSGPSGASDDGLPMTIKPVTLSISTFGCPFINFGQQFFCDFQTNTTTDDIYAVSGVSHTLTPGEFKTDIKLTPLNKLGQFRSMVDTLEEAEAVAEELSKVLDKK